MTITALNPITGPRPRNRKVPRRGGQYSVTESLRLACQEVKIGTRHLSLVALPDSSTSGAKVRLQRLASVANINLTGLTLTEVSDHVVEVGLTAPLQKIADSVHDAVVFLSRNPDATITLKLPSSMEPGVRSMLETHNNRFELVLIGPDRYGMRELPAATAQVSAA